tara:strand:+ start:204 stop:689 length:486 start_codon:yes stop_codon:yes gene_type:complete
MPRKKDFSDDKVGSRRSTRDRTQKREDLSDTNFSKNAAKQIREARIASEYSRRKIREKKSMKRNNFIWELNKEPVSRNALLRTFQSIIYLLETEYPATKVENAKLPEISCTSKLECAKLFKEIAVLISVMLKDMDHYLPEIRKRMGELHAISRLLQGFYID